MINSVALLVMLVVLGIFVVLGIVVIIMVFRFVGRRSANRNPANDAEEIRMMQETYKSLQRMESRIEALETILLEGEKGDKEEE